jgi:hypothetical protein
MVPAIQASLLTWSIETVDAAAAVGYWTSMALDVSDRPHISYYDYHWKDLKYARWTGSGWAIETVDTVGDVGDECSLALDSNDRPHISYFDRNNTNLMYARWTGSAWAIETVDAGGHVGRFSSIALDSSGYPHISYLNYTTLDFDLMYARWTGSAWVIETVDGSPDHVGYWTSIAVDSSDYAHISYFDLTNLDLMYARWTGSTWAIESVDTAGRVGECSCIALDASDRPHISYTEFTNMDLMYARWTGSAWAIETVDAATNVGYGTSIALSSSGLPHISYIDWGERDLMYARWTGSAWALGTIDSVGDVGHYSSIVVDSSDHPRICYGDNTNGNLKLARAPDEYFYDCSYTPFDSNGDSFHDAVQVDMDVDTTHSGSLDVYVHAYLRDPSDNYAAFDDPSWSITSTATEWGHALLYLPPGAPPGLYDIELFLSDEDNIYEDHWIVYDEVYLYPPDMMELTIEVEGPGTTDPAPGSWWVLNGTVVPVDAIPNPGCMLDHWLLDSVIFEPDDPFPVTMDDSHVLRAVFTEIPPDTHELLIAVEGNGTTIPSPGSHAYLNGTVVSVEAVPDAGWMLDHWVLDAVDQGAGNPINVTMDTSHVLVAVLTPPTEWQLTVGIVGAGDTDPPPGDHLYPDGTAVQVTAFPAGGWMLNHWLLDDVDVGQENPFPLVMNADHNLTSVFVELPPDMRELTIEVAGAGDTDPAPGNHTYSVDTVVSVNALPAAGWMLDHWLLDAVDQGAGNPINVTMDTDHVLTAVFAETPSGPATLTGLVLYNGQPISDFTSQPAVFWARNETSGEAFPISPSYNTSTGEYAIPDVPPGQYGLSGFIDDALPVNGAHGYAGDFEGWISPIVVAEGQAVVYQNLTVFKTLHLTSPVDNAASIGPMEPKDTYPPDALSFRWDALAEAVSYQATVTEYDAPFTYVGTVTNTTTSNVEWNVSLPVSAANHFYLFELYAYNLHDLLVGRLMVPYDGGYGSDYRFRIALQAGIESCNATGHKQDRFDVGEAVCVAGGNYSPSTTYALYIVADVATWSDGMSLPDRVSDTAPTIASNIDGDIPPTAVWSNPQTLGKYDIVVDVNDNGVYDAGIDALDDNDVEVTAGFIIPELPAALLLPLFLLLSMAVMIMAKSSSPKKTRT